MSVKEVLRVLETQMSVFEAKKFKKYLKSVNINQTEISMSIVENPIDKDDELCTVITAKNKKGKIVKYVLTHGKKVRITKIR